jgi:hypothetical protein
MRVRLTSLFPIFVVLLAGALCASRITEAKKAMPPAAKELVGVWIGFDKDELTFNRLDLRGDSTGFLARVSPADTILHEQGVHVYRIQKWAVNGWNIEVQLVPESNAFAVGYVRGRIDLDSMRLTIGGPENGGWKEEPFLQPESRISTSNQETKNRIEELEKDR